MNQDLSSEVGPFHRRKIRWWGFLSVKIICEFTIDKSNLEILIVSWKRLNFLKDVCLMNNIRYVFFFPKTHVFKIQNYTSAISNNLHYTTNHPYQPIPVRSTFARTPFFWFPSFRIAANLVVDVVLTWPGRFQGCWRWHPKVRSCWHHCRLRPTPGEKPRPKAKLMEKKLAGLAGSQLFLGFFCYPCWRK